MVPVMDDIHEDAAVVQRLIGRMQAGKLRLITAAGGCVQWGMPSDGCGTRRQNGRPSATDTQGVSRR